MASDLSFYDIFAQKTVPFLKISDDVIDCDLWFGSPPQSKILATPMLPRNFVDTQVCGDHVAIKRGSDGTICVAT